MSDSLTQPRGTAEGSVVASALRELDPEQFDRLAPQIQLDLDPEQWARLHALDAARAAACPAVKAAEPAAPGHLTVTFSWPGSGHSVQPRCSGDRQGRCRCSGTERRYCSRRAVGPPRAPTVPVAAAPPQTPDRERQRRRWLLQTGRRHHCAGCGRAFLPAHLRPRCPRCSAAQKKSERPIENT